MAHDGASGWATLPTECLRRVLSLAVASGARTLGAAACVCVSWRAAAEDVLLWRRAFDAERVPRGGVRSALVGTSAGGHADVTRRPAQLATAKQCRDATRERRQALPRIAAADPVRSRSLLDQTPALRRQYCRSLCVYNDVAVACVGDGLSWAAQLVARLSSEAPASGAAAENLHYGGGLLVTWAGQDTPIVCSAGNQVGFSDVEEALSLRDRTVAHPPLVRSFASLSGAAISSLASTVDAAGRCTVAALATDGVVGFWHVWREEADAQSPPFRSEPIAQLSVEVPAAAGTLFPGASCIQLSTDGTVVASLGSWFGGSYVGVARVSTPDATWSPTTLALTITPGEPPPLLQGTSLSFQAVGPVDAVMTGGALEDCLVLGSNVGLCVLPGAIARGAPSGSDVVLLHRCSTVHCHQQGVADSPSVVACGDSSGAAMLIDARAPRGTGVSWLRLPNDSGGATRSLHAYGHFIATGHNDGCACPLIEVAAAFYACAYAMRYPPGTRIFDIRMANNARCLLGAVAPPRPAAVTAVHLDERWLVVVTLSSMTQYDWHG